MELIDYSSGRKGSSSGVAAYDSALIARIVEALQRYGGESHRRFVIDHIVDRSDSHRRTQALSDAVIACFDRHCAGGSDAIFVRRFGEGSHRWGLGPGAGRRLARHVDDPVVRRAAGAAIKS